MNQDLVVAPAAAGRLLLREVKAHIRHGDDFALETTLAGRSYLKLVDQLRAADDIGSRLTTSLAAINPGGGNSWTARTFHPGQWTRRRSYQGRSSRDSACR